MQKELSIISGDKIFDISVRPGTTSHDILSGLGLKGHWLSSSDSLQFGDNENVYGLVQDGQKLFASAPADVALV